ncbi:MAG TPA: carboxymuconolactone decarboxylase family protein [Polyangiaceae bacterium]|nr:carboxymuconolactone decarboxylase family protein [Polyangiaceae bacterium]
MKSPALTLTGARDALLSISKSTESSGVPRATLELVHLRVGQINGCSVCVDMHCRMLKKSGESDERLFAIAAWRDAPYFNDAERAALALAEALTRIADSPDPVPDTIWNEAAKHFDETALAAILVAIANINVWNRLNVATRAVAGHWKP